MNEWTIKKTLEIVLRMTREELASAVPDEGNPFANAGANAAQHLDAEQAYRQVLDELDEGEIERMLQSINARAWTSEEYHRVATVMVAAAKKLSTII